MTPDARKVPTEAGWWLRDGAGNVYLAQVDIDPVDGILSFWTDDGRLHEDSGYVRDDGRWLCPVLTPAESDAITATVARLERERDDAAAMLAVAHAEIARLREARKVALTPHQRGQLEGVALGLRCTGASLAAAMIDSILGASND